MRSLYKSLVLILFISLAACDANELLGRFGADSEAGQLGLIYFPPGDCETGYIEVQFNEQEFATLQVGQCLRESVNLATTALRVRCIDPEGSIEPSNWVGPAVADQTVQSDTCSEIVDAEQI